MPDQPDFNAVVGQQAAQEIGTYVTTTGHATEPAMTVPSGCVGLRLIKGDISVLDWGPTLRVEGAQTGAVYYSLPTSDVAGPTLAFGLALRAGDSAIIVEHTDSGNGTLVAVEALFTPQSMGIDNQPLLMKGIAAQPMFAELVLSGGVVVADLQPLPVYVAPRISATQLLAKRVQTAALAPGGSGTLIAGVVGQVITVHGWTLCTNIAATAGVYLCHLEGATSGFEVATVMQQIFTAAGVLSANASLWVPPGIQLGSGEALRAHSDASSSGNLILEGTIYYTQV